MNEKIILRKKLIDEFSNIEQYAITIAVAPMGYGKTTAALEYLKKKSISYIWLSLETEQDNCENIWDTFCRQFGFVDSNLGLKLSKLGFPDDVKKFNYFLKELYTVIGENDTVLVIDDYHFSSTVEIDSFIYRLSKASTPNLKILILSRTLPDIRLEELKLKNICYTISIDRFILSKSEVAKYFRQSRIIASKNIIDRTFEISEGWISAVKLIAQKYDVTGNIDNITSLDNLIKEIITSKYSTKEIDLLIKLSIFDSFTLHQAHVVLEVPMDDIFKVIQNNTFIRYDKKAEEYRIHNILSNYLADQLIIKIDNKEQLYRNSGIWYVNNSQVINGIKCFIKAKDYKSILVEYSRNSSAHLFIRYRKFMYDTFKLIPEDLIYEYPYACLNYASFLITIINPKEGYNLLEGIKGYVIEADNIDSAEANKIQGEIYHLLGILQYNNVHSMIEYLKKAHDLLGDESNICNIKKQATLGSTSILFSYHTRTGFLQETVQLFSQNFYYYEKISQGCGRGIQELATAEYELEKLNIEEAKLYAKKALVRARTTSQLDIILLATYQLAKIEVYEGRKNNGLELMKNIDEIEDIFLHPTARSQYEICISDIYFAMNQYKYMTDWIREGNFERSKMLTLNIGLNYISHGKALLLSKDYLKLEISCDNMKDAMLRYNNLIGIVHIYIQVAIAKYYLYGIDAAKDYIDEAISLTKPDKLYMIWIEYDTLVLPILKGCSYNMPYTSDLINIIQSKVDRDNRACVLLTERENNIMILLKKGMTNKEIGKTLYIAEITVKKILSNIYKKYNVKNKRELLDKC